MRTTDERENGMETREIGSLRASVVGLGCNNFGRRVDAAGTERVVDAALDAGVNFFDTADIYGKGESEEYLGRALRGRRQQVLIATKFGMEMAEGRQGAHPDYVRESVEGSLKRLGTDYIDLYQLHRPDPAVPIADTLGALDELVRAGKVREIGCSNFSVEQLREAEAAAGRAGGARFVSVQNEYSMLHREPERGVLEACERLGLAFLPFFPLASGLLTGKYRRGKPAPQGTRITSGDRYADLLAPEKLDLGERRVAFAESRGHTLLELAFSWLLARPVVASVIAGATKPEQVTANAAAAGWRLSAEEMEEVDGMLPKS
ncbi:MAG TPA: aldo/keto reductase [Longimicrobiaceae bacterium]|nr:aldo/keto reductase [Longimicrobiaceae bacterium]